MAAENPFTPAGTVSRTVTGSTANVALSKGTTPGPTPNQIMVTSPSGGTLAFIKFGDSTVTAAVTDTPILPGAIMIFSIPPATTYVAAIGTSGTTLYFTSGEGA